MAFVPRKFGIAKPTPNNLQQSLNETVIAVDELAGVGDRMQRAVRAGELIEIGLLGYDAGGKLVLQSGETAEVVDPDDPIPVPTDEFVKLSGDVMTGPLTVANNWTSAQAQTMGLHVKSGTMVMGNFPPEHFYWYRTYANNSYLTLDKLTADNDASLVFTEAGRGRWEFGATTQAMGDPARLHLKRILTPTADDHDDQFHDVFTVEWPSGNMWVNRGYQFWVGALPTVPDIMFSVVETFDAPDRRVTVKIQNWNAVPGTPNPEAGSQSSCLIVSGVDSSWVVGNDVGLTGEDNFFIQQGNATEESFRLYADVSGVAINGTYLEPTEAFRINAKLGQGQGFMPPSVTTPQRDAMGSKNAGLLINNVDANALQRWNGALWETLGPAGTGGGGDPGTGVQLDEANVWTALQEFQAAIQISTGGGFGPGRLYQDASLGLVIATITGSVYDMQLCTPAGSPVLTLDTGTTDLTAWGKFTTTKEIKIDANGLGLPAQFAVTADPSTDAGLAIRTSGVMRWDFGKVGATDAFSIRRYNDSGVFQDSALTIDRTTGVATFFAVPEVSGAALALNSAVVHTTGAENVSGVKTFLNNPVIGDGSGAGARALTIDSTAGTVSDIFFKSSGASRWLLRKNGTAESGGNAGSDLQLFRYTDAGAASSILTVTRSSGVFNFGQTPQVGGADVWHAGNITLASGIYTPTFTNVANVAAFIAYPAQYMRVGDVVTVSGRVDIDVTAAALTQLRISLPIASNLAATNDLAGVASSRTESASVYAAVTPNEALIDYTAVSLANNGWFFTFTYRVI